MTQAATSPDRSLTARAYARPAATAACHSVPDLLFHWAERAPERTLAICGSRRLSYGALAHQISNTAAFLAASGVGPGDRVAIRSADKIAFMVAAMGVMARGAIAVPLDAPDSEGQASVIADCTPTLVLADDGALAGCRVSTRSITEAAADPAPGPVAGSINPAALPDQPAAILYTSGTQNRRKGVLLSNSNLMESARFINSFFGYDESVVEYVVAPLEHAFGFCRFRCVIETGGTIVFDNGPFNALKVVRALDAHGCNAVASVAACLAILIKDFAPHLDRFAEHIRWVEIGSQTLQREYKDRLCQAWPRAKLVQNFGMSEAVRSTMVDLNAELTHRDSCGRAVPGVDVRVTDETGVPVPAGTPGIVEIRGPQVALSYWGRDDLWRERLNDGWFRSDDIGYLNGEGYLHYVSRRDDLINMSGEKISPLDLETAFRMRMDGQSFCVCAAADPGQIRGEAPVLCLEGHAFHGATFAELRKRLAGTVPNRHLPQMAVRLPEFPRTGVGKIQRPKLRRMIEANTVERID